MAIQFPYELDTITLRKRTADTKVDLYLNDVNIFSATLTPDSDGNVVLYDMGRYIADKVSEADTTADFGQQTLEVWADQERQTQHTLRPCRSRMRKKAAELLPTMFLTMASGGTKFVSETTDNEPLYMLTDEAAGAYSVDITLYWQNTQTGKVEVRTEQQEGNAKPGQVFRMNMAPTGFAAPDQSGLWTLISYEARSGARYICYQVMPRSLAWSEQEQLQFRNSFGLTETFYLAGATESEVKPTYSAAMVNGSQTNYLIERNTTYKGNTGPLTDATIALMVDLSTSKQVTCGGRKVTLTACELKPTTAYSEQQKGTITWREAAEGGTSQPALPQGTFDRTFDATFDRTT